MYPQMWSYYGDGLNFEGPMQ